MNSRGQPPAQQINQPFPYDCWYIAGRSSEFGRSLCAREFLDIPLVLYRQENGIVVALDDRCAHRGMPLSAGRLHGDEVECGYHGFRFGPDGSCVSVPSQPRVPYGACVRSFPVHEQAPVVWVWLGDPARAGERPPPELPWLTDEGWTFAAATMPVAANYMTLHENSLDLTHFPFVHPELSPPVLDVVPPPLQLEVSELLVSYHRTFPAARLPQWQAHETGLDLDRPYVQRETGTFVSPALLLKFFDVVTDEEQPDSVYRTVYIRGFTPQTAASTHVFSWIARNYALTDSAVTERLRDVDSKLLEQDRDVVELVQEQLDRYGAPASSAFVNTDFTATRAHEIVENMLVREGPSASRHQTHH